MERELIIRELIRGAIDSVRPEIFIPDLFFMKGNTLIAGSRHFPLDAFDHVYVVSIGKAAVGMAAAADRLIHPFVTEGVILAKHLPETGIIGAPYHILCGSHPVPTADSMAGAEAILSLLDHAGERDLVLFLISGGGSALMTSPIGGLSLDTLQDFSRAILGCGADISEFNTLRKHLDGVKGGRLAQRAAPARLITVILSDVIGSPPDIIASGPTVPDPSTYADALKILDKYAEKTAFPPAVRDVLERGVRGELPETLKEGDPVFDRADYFLAADNRRAAFAAAERGKELGLNASVINTRLTGEASFIGRLLPSFFSELSAPGLLIFGGETTVTIRGSGLGGRNLELALAAVRPMADWPGCALVTLATDGEDGPTDAAGAVVTSETLSRALALGLDPDEYLRNNDSLNFFERAGGILKPGPSGTNVCDLTFLLHI